MIDYGKCLKYPTMAFYNAVEVIEDFVSERAPLKSELKSSFLKIENLMC